MGKKRPYHLISLILMLTFSSGIAQTVITTIAGNGVPGFSGDLGPAVNSEVLFGYRAIEDRQGNIFIADAGNNRIRKIDPAGIITTIAGNGTAGYGGDGGPALAAALREPSDIVMDDFNNIFIADYGNHRIRKIDPSGTITTIAGTGVAGYAYNGYAAVMAQLNGPIGLAFDRSGRLYISEYFNCTIRVIDLNGFISTIAGQAGTCTFMGLNSPASQASLFNPTGIAFDRNGNLFIADQGSNQIRKINTAGTITTIAGNLPPGYSGDGGQAIAANLNYPFGVACDSMGNVFFSDRQNNVIRKVDPSGTISTVVGDGFGNGSECNGGYAGDNGSPIYAKLNNPCHISLDANGNLYIGDVCNNRIRKVSNMGTMTAINIPSTPMVNIKVYPNPANTSFTVSYRIGRNGGEVKMILSDLFGKTVLESVLPTEEKEITIRIEDLQPGVYCYRIVSDCQLLKIGKITFIK